MTLWQWNYIGSEMVFVGRGEPRILVAVQLTMYRPSHGAYRAMTLTSSFLFSQTTSLRATCTKEKDKSQLCASKYSQVEKKFDVPSHKVTLRCVSHPDEIQSGSLYRSLVTHPFSPKWQILTNQMHVDRVCPSPSSVLQNPVLNGTTFRLRKDAFLRPISPCDSINHPLAALAPEFEFVGDSFLVWREVHLAELSWKLAIVACIRNGVADNKSHNLVGVEVGIHIGNVSIAPQRDVLIPILREIKDDFPALSDRGVELSGVDWIQKQAGVGANHLHVRSFACSSFEVQFECARGCCVQEAQTILPGLYLQEGPWLAVGVDDITE